MKHRDLRIATPTKESSLPNKYFFQGKFIIVFGDLSLGLQQPTNKKKSFAKGTATTKFKTPNTKVSKLPIKIRAVPWICWKRCGWKDGADKWWWCTMGSQSIKPHPINKSQITSYSPVVAMSSKSPTQKKYKKHQPKKKKSKVPG